MDKLVSHAPAVIIVLLFFLQQRIFVTPEQLEKKHREILEDADRKYASHRAFKDLKDQFSEMKEKIDKIYDCIINHKAGL